METENLNTIVKKTECKRTYMREYKQKKYKENPKLMNAKNQMYYYKNKCGFDTEMLRKYDTLLPYVAKIKLAVEEFKQNNIQLSIEFLTELIIQLRLESIELKNTILPNNLTEVLTTNLCI